MEDKCKIHDITLNESGICQECSLAESNPVLNGQPKPEINGEDKRQVPHEEGIKRVIKNRIDNKAPRADKTKVAFEDVNSEFVNAFIENEIGAVNFIHARTSSKIQLFKASQPLTIADCGELDDDSSELLLSLKKERILLLGDYGGGQAYSVSRQIAKSLEIENKEENIRLLSLYKHTTYKHKIEDPLDIRAFVFERETTDDEPLLDAVILIDGTKEGDNFADSLLNSGDSLPDDLSLILRENSLYLICFFRAKDITNWKENPEKRNFPYRVFKKKIDETEECENSADINQSVRELFNLESDTDGPITKNILFVASFFPNLPTDEFNNLVGIWLKNEPEVTRTELPANGAEETVVTKISLKQVWDSKSHIYTEQCFLFQTKNEQGKRIINFENESYSNCVKERLESRFFVFLYKKVSEILDFGLIFHSSGDVSNHSINILFEYIRDIEDRLMDWLMEIFKILESVENLDELRRYFKAEENIGKHFYYIRLAKLFRALLQDSSLETLVSSVLEQLIRNRCYKSVFILVRWLRNAPNFDELFWLKQLLERGDISTQKETIAYILSNLVNMKMSDVFERLKVWLPEEKKPLENYSRSNKAALILLIDYFSYQTHIFDEKLYGLEPSQFPLFIFDDTLSGDSQLEIIVKYLLHPANFILPSDDLPYIYDVAYLLEKWAEILFKKSARPQTVQNINEITENELPAESEFLDNKEILDSLLEQVALNSDKNKQDELLSIWESHIETLSLLIDDPTLGWKMRNETSEWRKVLRNLVERFKRSRRLKR